MFESRAGVLFIGGLGFFAFAFLANGVVPILMYKHLPEQSVSELTNANLMYQFEDLQRRWPEAFEKAYGRAPEPRAGATPEEQAANDQFTPCCSRAVSARLVLDL
jgi:hypothetical protein